MSLSTFISRTKNYLYFKRKTHVFHGRKRAKRILYFGIPMHTNLGDQAQKYCIRKWLKENYPDYEVLEIPTRIVADERFGFLNVLKKNVQNEDIIVFQSGYCTHDIAPSTEDLMHRIVIENFPNNRMLMLPQTVYFQSDERKKLSSEIYNKARHMLFLTRDRVSYAYAEEMFNNLTVRLFPDIVTSLIGQNTYSGQRSGVLLCTRKDCEKYYSDEDIDVLHAKLAMKCKVSTGDTTIPCDPYWLDKHLEEKLESVFAEYAQYRVVITDRYHGTIFSLIAGTPVIVVKTQDHKVSTGVEWFKDIYDYVYLAENLDEAYEKAIYLLDHPKEAHPLPYFKAEYYDKLKDLFEKVI